MKALTTTTVLILGLVLAAPAMAGDGKDGSCSTRSLAGRWIFATDVGQFPDFGGDITAIGTMNIDKKGNVSGEFDFTVAQVVFGPDITYEGSITVGADCTGTLHFVTSDGGERTDSIAVVGNGEMWGMSQDILNLWTYRARRISKKSRK